MPPKKMSKKRGGMKMADASGAGFFGDAWRGIKKASRVVTKPAIGITKQVVRQAVKDALPLAAAAMGPKAAIATRLITGRGRKRQAHAR